MPKDVPVVIVHGEADKEMIRDRGLREDGPMLSAGSLEEHIRTGSLGKCFLYYTRTQGGTFGTRMADGHNPGACDGSLLKDDCLPRLLDALVFTPQELFPDQPVDSCKLAGKTPVSKSMPAFTFPCTSLTFLSTERLAAERRLTYNPKEWFRRYVIHANGRHGTTTQKKFKVDPGTQEFKDVCSIFLSRNNDAPRFYFPDKQLARILKAKDIVVERIENAGQEGELDKVRKATKEELKNAGSDVVGGVHTRWLFHGCKTLEILDLIVGGELVGFDINKSGAGLWGQGSYFARDPEYSIYGGFGSGCKKDGKKMLMLCLVECGLPTLGERHLTGDNMPYVGQPSDELQYTSTIDSLANPELFCLPKNFRAYPAYVIHFPAHIGV